MFFLPFSEALPRTAYVLWTLLSLALLVLPLLGRSRPQTAPLVWIFASLLAIVGILSSSTNAEDVQWHLITGVQLLAFLLLGPFGLRKLVANHPRSITVGVAAFMAGQSVSAMASFAQILGIPVFGYKALLGRAPGLAGHPNLLGIFAAIALVVSVYGLCREGKKAWLLLSLLVNVGGLLVSGSVSALIATGIGILVVMISARAPLKVPLLIAGGAALSLWALVQLTAETELFRGPVQRILQVTGQTNQLSTLDIRENTYAFAWDGIQKDPLFGAGLDDGSGATYDYITLTHNVLLRSWFQGGLGLFSAFALIYIAAVCLIVRSLVKGRDASSAGVLAVLVSFSMTSAALQQGYFWILILGAWALIEPTRQRPPGDPLIVDSIGLTNEEGRPGALHASYSR
ncbi:O-antigen ligase family protein [Paenarthrobacter sp.]|uniref:O-antigen ligase family protein n=1 Tax=Paenarthrobacter sp. TaxID=1931993 RepID=UPI002812852E|nr:O-antigen ligase family protein [Paenarthrobacter sp.]